MKRPNEVLFRLHSIRPPEILNVETAIRDDELLKKQHEELCVLPGIKVFETRLPQDKPWRLDGVPGDMRLGGYTLLNMSVELRPGAEEGSIKPVTTLNFGMGTSTCTAEQIAWVEEYLGRAVFKLAQAYHNPRTNGTSQLAVDCCQAAKFEPGLMDLPLRRLLGLKTPAAKTTPA